MLISPASNKFHELPVPSDEVSRLLHLIDQVHGGSAPPAADYAQVQYATPIPDDKRDGIRLPGLSAIFPAFSSGRSGSISAYPTPMSSDPVLSSTTHSPSQNSPYISPEQHAMSTHLKAVRRGFAFHRKCNRHAFIAYDETQVDRLLEEFQSSVADTRQLNEIKTCELFSVSVIGATFYRVEIPAETSDMFYKVASERIGNWALSQPLTAMRCCALLGLANLFQKATISLLYFDLALSLANGLWRTLNVDTLDVSRPDHVEFQQIWRSLVFGRAWLQSTIGACTADDQLWLPPITTKADDGIEVDATTQIRILIPIEIARVAVIAARAMRILAACTSPDTLLPAVRSLFGEIGDWYDSLPQIAGATELSQTPWDESKVCLAYVHLGHLGAITLIFRRTLSVYRHKFGGQKHHLQPAERSQLATIFNDGIIAAKQSSRILYLFLGEQAGIRHCWAVMYTLPPSSPSDVQADTFCRYIAFVSASILLYCTSQMQLHDYPEHEWQPCLNLVDNDMEILAYCQELDPVASRLRDTLSQYMQFLRMPSLAPRRKPAPQWGRAMSGPQREQQGQDIVDLLLTIPAGRAGPAQTSMDLLKLVCQPFNDDAGPSSSTSNGYKVPHVLGNLQQRAPHEKWNNQATHTWMPFGWQQCQTSAVFTGRSTNLALTIAQQQEMLRAGV